MGGRRGEEIPHLSGENANQRVVNGKSRETTKR